MTDESLPQDGEVNPFAGIAEACHNGGFSDYLGSSPLTLEKLQMSMEFWATEGQRRREAFMARYDAMSHDDKKWMWAEHAAGVEILGYEWDVDRSWPIVHPKLAERIHARATEIYNERAE